MKLLSFLKADALFKSLKIDSEFSELRQLASLEASAFEQLVYEPICKFAEWVQLAPASQSHHHAGPGGLIKHTLDVLRIALKKRRGLQLPIGGSVEEINRQRHIWTFAIVTGCLLHDIGKLSSSIRLNVIRSTGVNRYFCPLAQNLEQLLQDKTVLGYQVVFEPSAYRYHEQLSVLHLSALLPAYAQAWLISAPHIMKPLINFLWGDRYESGMIGSIIEFADGESTARDLQLPSSTERFSNQIPAIERYINQVRHLLMSGVVKVNQNGGMAWIEGEFIYFVCRPLVEKLIQELNAQGLRNLPQDPLRIYDMLQEHGYAIPTEDGKAIWSIKVSAGNGKNEDGSGNYSHKFTCLKFEVRRLITPTKSFPPFEGKIEIAQANEPEPDVSSQDTVIPIRPTLENEKIILDADEQRMIGKTDAESDTDHKPPETAEEIEKIIPDAAAETAVENGSHSQDTAMDAEHHSAGILEKLRKESGKETTKTKSESGVNKTVNVYADTMPLQPLFDYAEADAAHRFINWLRRGLIEKTILINNPTAEVHIAEEGVFVVAPSIFKTFLMRHGISPDKHKNFVRRINTLKLHIRNGDLNIHPYWVSGKNRKTKINGYLFPFNVFYEEGMPIPKKNKFLIRNLEDTVTSSDE